MFICFTFHALPAAVYELFQVVHFQLSDPNFQSYNASPGISQRPIIASTPLWLSMLKFPNNNASPGISQRTVTVSTSIPLWPAIMLNFLCNNVSRGISLWLPMVLWGLRKSGEDCRGSCFESRNLQNVWNLLKVTK